MYDRLVDAQQFHAFPAERISFAPLISLLLQMDELLAAISDEDYVQQPVGVIQSSFGGHIRHCLNHVGALLASIESGAINYDQRVRGTKIESVRTAARELIKRYCKALSEVDEDAAQTAVVVTTVLTAGGSPVTVDSTIGRELAFVLSHTIHHNALIAAMCRTLGVPLPDHFGYAPATIAHLNETACVL